MVLLEVVCVCECECDMYPAWCSLNLFDLFFMVTLVNKTLWSLVWCLALILENFQPLFFQILILLHSFLFCYSNFACVTLFYTVPQFLDVWSFHTLFPLYFSLGNLYWPDSILSLIKSTQRNSWKEFFFLLLWSFLLFLEFLFDTFS